MKYESVLLCGVLVPELPATWYTGMPVPTCSVCRSWHPHVVATTVYSSSSPTAALLSATSAAPVRTFMMISGYYSDTYNYVVHIIPVHQVFMLCGSVSNELRTRIYHELVLVSAARRNPAV